MKTKTQKTTMAIPIDGPCRKRQRATATIVGASIVFICCLRGSAASRFPLPSTHRELNPAQPHATSYSQRHNGYHNSPYTFIYDDDDDDDYGTTSFRRGYNMSTDLSDVWLCLLTALAWAVWMIRSMVQQRQSSNENWLQRPDLLHVHGNVLQVDAVDDGLGIINKVVIDYVISNQSTDERVQIRKHFETRQLLEPGFANVELLVLPEEPTNSIIKGDQRPSLTESEDDGDDWLLDLPKYRQLSTVFASLLIVASLAGTIQVVHLMDEQEQWKGWVSVCVGVTLLLPVALFIVSCMSGISFLQNYEKRGYVVEKNGKHVKKEQPSQDASLFQQAVLPCSNLCDPDVASYVVPETSGCYFINLEKQRPASPEQSSHNSMDSSVSSISTEDNIERQWTATSEADDAGSARSV